MAPGPDVALDPDPVIGAHKQDIDRTLIRENLKPTPAQRLRQLMKLQEFAEELQAPHPACRFVGMRRRSNTV